MLPSQTGSSASHTNSGSCWPRCERPPASICFREPPSSLPSSHPPLPTNGSFQSSPGLESMKRVHFLNFFPPHQGSVPELPLCIVAAAFPADVFGQDFSSRLSFTSTMQLFGAEREELSWFAQEVKLHRRRATLRFVKGSAGCQDIDLRR